VRVIGNDGLEHHHSDFLHPGIYSFHTPTNLFDENGLTFPLRL
jgi:hypothetical protein